MNRLERQFFNGVRDALSDYECELDCYHDDGTFTVTVSFDMEEWGDRSDEIAEDLNSLFDDWDGGWDNDLNEYEVWFNNED